MVHEVQVTEPISNTEVVNLYAENFVTTANTEHYLSPGANFPFPAFPSDTGELIRVISDSPLDNGINNRFMGIAAPTDPITVFTIPDEEASIDYSTPAIEVTNVAGGDLPNGAITYKVYPYMFSNMITNYLHTPTYITVTNVADDGTTEDRVSAKRARSDNVPDSYSKSEEEFIQGEYDKVSNDLTPITTTVIAPTGRTVELKLEVAAATIFRLYEGVWYLVGNTTTNVTDSVYDISGNPTEAAFLNPPFLVPFDGTYQFVYTYYNSLTGEESAPSPPSAEYITPGASRLLLTVTGSLDPQVDRIRVYRIGGKVTEFTSRVADYPNGDSSGLPYTATDEELLDSGITLSTDGLLEAPIGLQYLTESYAMLFGALGSELRFTPIGIPHAWPADFGLIFDQPITGIAPVATGLLVFTESETHLVTGTGPTTLAKQLLRGDQGCISHDSIQKIITGSAIWASLDGLCISNGNYPTVVSKDPLGTLRLDSIINSAVANEVYYLRSNGSVLAYDFRFTPKFYTLSALGQSDSLAVKKDELYYVQNEEIFQAFASTDTVEQFSYTSPRFTEGSLTETKTYKKFYFSNNYGIIGVKIYINDNLVFDGDTDPAKQVTDIQVKQEEQRGYYVQFELTGSTTVNEVEYISEGKKEMR